jgi:tyrosine-protein kinase Etk/Wzc
VNMAAVFALLGKKTLVVGLDLRKPRMQRIFGTSERKGLSNFLIGECGVEDIIQNTEVPNLYFTNSGPIPPNPSELIESERMKMFLDKTKEEYDLIILDTPPIGIVSDAFLLADFADINMFIVRQRYSSKSTLEFIQNIYESKEINKPVIVVNDILVSGYYGYGIRYGSGLYPGYGYDYGYGRYGNYNYGKNGNYYVED